MTDDDCTLGEYFAGFAEASKQRRAHNRESSAQILRERGIQFESKNNEAHLIVTYGKVVIDFWPGTGLWAERKGKHKGRGVFRLLTLLGKQ